MEESHFFHIPNCIGNHDGPISISKTEVKLTFFSKSRIFKVKISSNVDHPVSDKNKTFPRNNINPDNFDLQGLDTNDGTRR